MEKKNRKRKTGKADMFTEGILAGQSIKKEPKAPKQAKITDAFKEEKLTKKKRKIDRFDGLAEEEVLKKTLPDHLDHGLDILIIGINPGLFAAYKGHHYAGPGNHFWKCLYLSQLIPQPMTALDDYKLIKHGIGFTNIVTRTTKGSADLSRKEIKDGADILIEKLRLYKPKIAAFNGKMIYEVFSGKKKFVLGMQPDPIEGTETTAFVMPSSSARCAQLPRAVDKVPYYLALKKLRDHLCGRLPDLDYSLVTFSDLKLKFEMKSEPIREELTIPTPPPTIKEEPPFEAENGLDTNSSNSAGYEDTASPYFIDDYGAMNLSVPFNLQYNPDVQVNPEPQSATYHTLKLLEPFEIKQEQIDEEY